MVLIQLPTALIASAAKGHNRYAVARRFARHAHRGFTKGALTIEPAFPDDGQRGIAKMTVGVKQFEHQVNARAQRGARIGDQRGPHSARSPGAGPFADVVAERLLKLPTVVRHTRLQLPERRLVRAFLRAIHPGGAIFPE